MRKKIALGGLVVAVVLVAVPAFSATRPGSVTITSLAANQPAGGIVKVEWTFRSGTEVDSLDLVNAFVTSNGLTWTKIADRLPIRQGAFDWDTSSLTDGAYAVKLKVYKEPISTIVSPVFVDNAAPVVDIVRPAPNQLIVDDAGPEYAVVAGVATLQAVAEDALTGVASVTWFVDDEEIVPDAGNKYDFGAAPGPHTLKAVATDYAGNSSEDVVAILALPGPSTVAGGELPIDPDQDPTTLIPSDLPVDPDQDPTTLLPVDPDQDPTTLLPVDPNQDPTTLIPSEPPVDPNQDPQGIVDQLPIDLP